MFNSTVTYSEPSPPPPPPHPPLTFSATPSPPTFSYASSLPSSFSPLHAYYIPDPASSSDPPPHHHHRPSSPSSSSPTSGIRPRVRGRFVRSGDADTTEAIGNCYAHQRSECNFDSSSSSSSSTCVGCESQNSEEKCCFLDEDLWVNFADDLLPVNFLY